MNETVNKKTLAAKLILCGVFITILVSFVRGNELVAVFSRPDWYYLTFSLLLGPLMLVVSCLKWKVLLDLSGKRLRFRELLRIYLVGYFFSNLLPSTVGGDVARSYYSGRLIGNQAFAAVCVFVERFSGLFLLLILVILAPAVRPGLYASPFFYVPAAVAFFLICLVMLVWKVREPLSVPDRMVTIILERIHGAAEHSRFSPAGRWAAAAERLYQRFKQMLTRMHDELRGATRLIRGNIRSAWAIVLLTVLFYVLTWVNVYVSFRAFGVDPGFVMVVALVPTIMFVAHAPLTFLGNLGFFESVFVFYFLQSQVLPEETLAMGILLRIKMLLLGLAGLYFYVMNKRAWLDRIPEPRQKG
jgi:glycosyltransferase 2 family protein